MMLCIRKILIHRAMHIKILIQRVPCGKIADMSETDPRTHGESPNVNVRGSVTANIGWYVVLILHDKAIMLYRYYMISIAVGSILWVEYTAFFVCVFHSELLFSILVSIYMIGISCNIETT